MKVLDNGSEGQKAGTVLDLTSLGAQLAPEVIRSSGLLGPSGWIHVDAQTLCTSHDGVFAIGDVTSIKRRDGKAGFARGRFFADPSPEIRMYRPG